MRDKVLLTHKFVEFIPRELEANTVYVSITYATAIHSCCCGCGNRVVTPISPADWKLIFDGQSISLEPSIGNWSFPCRSHYWIRNNRVVWSDQWSDEEVDAVRKKDARATAAYFNKKHGGRAERSSSETTNIGNKKAKSGLKSKIKNWFGVRTPPG
jgi:hypothetical protein